MEKQKMNTYETYKLSEELREMIEKDKRWDYFFWGLLTGYAGFSIVFMLFQSIL